MIGFSNFDNIKWLVIVTRLSDIEFKLVLKRHAKKPGEYKVTPLCVDCGMVYLDKEADGEAGGCSCKGRESCHYEEEFRGTLRDCLLKFSREKEVTTQMLYEFREFETPPDRLPGEVIRLYQLEHEKGTTYFIQTKHEKWIPSE